MEDIRIYDFEFNLLHIENDILTSNWSIYFNDIGTWEGHFYLDSDIVPVIMGNDYLVVVQGQKQAIVTGKIADGDLAVYGRTVNWILSRRTIPKFKTFDLAIGKDVESIARYVVGTAFADVSDFILGDVVGFTTENDFWRNTTNSVDKVVKECLDNESAGHKVVFDTTIKKWVFQVLKGIVNPLIISKGNRNAQNMRYTEDIQEYYSGGWYDQTYGDVTDWNASTNTPTLTNNLLANYAKKYKVSVAGTQFGITFAKDNYIHCNTKNGAWQKSTTDDSSFWAYIEGTKTGIYKWDSILSGSVESEAKSALAAKKRNEKTTSETIDLVYGVDYNLGDTAKVQLEIGAFKKTITRKIIGVSFWYENNNVGEKPIFKEDDNEQLQS